MTPAFVECSDAMMRLYALSAFLCSNCRKLTGKMNATFRDMQALINLLKDELKEATIERKKLAERVAKLEGGAEQVKE